MLSVRNGELNTYDYNEYFGQVAFAAATMSFTSSSVTRSSGHKVNNEATYRFTALIDISSGHAIGTNTRISLKLGENLLVNSATVQVTIVAGFGPNPPVQDTHYSVTFLPDNWIDVIVIGTPDSPATTFTIDIAKVQNQGWAGTPGTFSIRLWENNY